MTDNNTDRRALLDMAVDIVSAYVGANTLPPEEVPGLIERVFAKLADLSDPSEPEPAERPEPAVPIDESVTDDVIYSLEDGQPYRSLKRHLRSRYGMSPDDYRKKWGLPPDYPMVAPGYARERSELAKKSGLGKNKDRFFR